MALSRIAGGSSPCSRTRLPSATIPTLVAQATLPRQHPVAPARVDEEPRRDLAPAPVRRALAPTASTRRPVLLHGQAPDPVGGPARGANRRPLVHARAVRRRGAQEDPIHLRAQDLEAHRVARIDRLFETEEAREISPRGDELDPPLLDEAFPERLAAADPLEDPHVVRQERLSDVKPREGLALEQDHVAAGARQQDGGGQAAGPAADHRDVMHRLLSGDETSVKVPIREFLAGAFPRLA